MSEGGDFMRRYLVWWCCFLLAGCGNNMANQIIEEAKIAFEDKSYQRAVGLLKLASDESSNKNYEIWFEQGEAFLNMLQYDDLALFDELLLAWTDLNLIDSKPSFVKEEAVAYIKEKLESVKLLAKEALETKEDQAVIQVIQTIEKRLGTLKLFKEEMKELTNLKQKLEG